VLPASQCAMLCLCGQNTLQEFCLVCPKFDAWPREDWEHEAQPYLFHERVGEFSSLRWGRASQCFPNEGAEVPRSAAANGLRAGSARH